MKKSISIKIFTLLVIFSLFTSGSYIFYIFYNDSKNTTESLLEENIQFNLLDIKYFLDRNLKENNVNQLRAYLNNIVFANNIIEDMHIIDDKNRLLYATDGDTDPLHQGIECIPIADILNSDLFNQRCYTFNIKLFKRLTPYYYRANVYLNKEYLDSLIKDKIIKYSLLFLAYVFILVISLWFIIQKLIIRPLEDLRLFSHFSQQIPKPFIIQELESIRTSLIETFARLKKEQEELFKLSTKDSLSGLYNRLSLIEKINWFITKNRREKKEFAVLFLDLDNFKNINDTKGHKVGDTVLKHVSRTLLKCVRANDIVARLGGDEFVIVLPDIENHAAIVEVVQRIRSMISQPIEVEGYKYHITCSIGVTIYPKDGHTVTELLKNADIAMYKSKELGKNNFHFFTSDLNEIVQNKMQIQQMMNDALENGNFQLFYQPKTDLKTNKIVGCEALIRLIDPNKGIIPPFHFIPIAEESNFIIPLGEWIIEEAVRQIQAWKDTPLKDLKVSINISAAQFNDKNLYTKIAHAIQSIDPKKFDIELTESILIDNFETKLATIHALKDLGISLSLDDFGTGYSSLSYLKKIPFDTLKIDKSFIDDLENEKDRSFVQMIITIAKELGLDIVAEGVESQKQKELLVAMECELYQGYLCSKPLPAKEFEELFNTKQCP